MSSMCTKKSAILLVLCTKKSALLGLGNLMAGISRPGALGVSRKIHIIGDKTDDLSSIFFVSVSIFGFYGRFVRIELNHSKR